MPNQNEFEMSFILHRRSHDNGDDHHHYSMIVVFLIWNFLKQMNTNLYLFFVFCFVSSKQETYFFLLIAKFIVNNYDNYGCVADIIIKKKKLIIVVFSHSLSFSFLCHFQLSKQNSTIQINIDGSTFVFYF